MARFDVWFNDTPTVFIYEQLELNHLTEEGFMNAVRRVRQATALIGAHLSVVEHMATEKGQKIGERPTELKPDKEAPPPSGAS